MFVAIFSVRREVRERLRYLADQHHNIIPKCVTFEHQVLLDYVIGGNVDIVCMDINGYHDRWKAFVLRIRSFKPDLRFLFLDSGGNRMRNSQLPNQNSEWLVQVEEGIPDKIQFDWMVGCLLAEMLYHLTPRECEVFRHVSEGRSTMEIALLLDISANTVQVHRRRIGQKLGTANAAVQTRIAISLGLSSVRLVFHPSATPMQPDKAILPGIADYPDYGSYRLAAAAGNVFAAESEDQLTLPRRSPVAWRVNRKRRVTITLSST